MTPIRPPLLAILLLAACTASEPANSARADAPPASSGTWRQPVAVDGGAGATREEYLRAVGAMSLPEWAHARAEREGHPRALALAFDLNPFYQSGDFDGDGRLDVAVMVSRRATGETGVLLLHGGGSPSALVGAGEPFGNGGTDFRWMTNWRVRPDGEGSSRRDALEVVKLESAAGLIYRGGGGYRWRQTDD